MLLFKFLPEARLNWKTQNKNLTFVILSIWGVNIFFTMVTTIKKVYQKIKSLCDKGDILRQVAPYTAKVVQSSTVNTTEKFSRTQNV